MTDKTLREALERIAAIRNKLYGGDWDEIEEARTIARAALAAPVVEAAQTEYLGELPGGARLFAHTVAKQAPVDADLARIAREGFDSYWTEDCAGKDEEAWLASAKAVLAATPTQPEAADLEEVRCGPVTLAGEFAALHEWAKTDPGYSDSLLCRRATAALAAAPAPQSPAGVVKQFEQWLHSPQCPIPAGTAVTALVVRAAREAWQTAASLQQPQEGWVSVPREPTEAMVQAGVNALPGTAKFRWIVQDVYAFMIAASLPPPEGTEAQEVEPVALTDPLAIALNTMHKDCHKAADAFWNYWRENGETHKRGYYESTWGAINRALRTVGVVPWNPSTPPAATNQTANQGEKQ